MTKHPAARRVHRAAADEDAFVSGVLESSIWVRTHAQKLVVGGVALLLAVLVFLWFRNTQARTRQLAASELDAVRASVQSGNVQVARRDLQSYLQRYGGTPSGQEAKLMMGEVQLQAGEAQNAIATLRPLAGNVESSTGYSAALLLAAAYESSKQNDQADQIYLRIADDARFDYQQRDALDRAARLRAENGNLSGAIQLYERIIAGFDPEQVELAREKSAYEMRLAELRAQTAAKTRS